MSLSFRCTRCGRAYSVAGSLVDRKVRCRGCGLVQSIPMPSKPSADSPRGPGQDGYPLAEVAPTTTPMPASAPIASVPGDHSGSTGVSSSGRPRAGRWRRLVRDYAVDSSFLEQEVLLLVALSAADLLVTYALLRQGPSFYESNPFAQWVFQRWNIAGMTLFKFGVIGGVIVIGEVAERRRPGLGRGLMAISCVATAAVVAYGLRLLLGFGGNGGR
jgi:hypothetical protein